MLEKELMYKEKSDSEAKRKGTIFKHNNVIMPK